MRQKGSPREATPEAGEAGLTLVEILISSSIAAVVGILLLLIIVNSSGLFYKESAKVNLGLSANDALTQVRKSVKGSSAVALLYTAGSETYTSGVTQLVLQLPSLDSSGNIILNIFDYFVFLKDQSKLRFKTFPNALSSRKAQNQIFSNMVDNLVFQYFNFDNPPLEVAPTLAAKVRITLTLKQKMGVDHEANIATTEANLRNN